MQQMQQQLQQQPPPQAKSEPNPQNVQVNLTPKFDVTPGAGSRVILGVPTNETIMHMDLDVSATATPQPGDTTASGQPMPTGPQTVNGTMTMTVDMFMAPSVPGYQEIGEFYHRMATEINWVPPSNIHVDPRADSGPHRAAEKFRRVQGPADARNHQHGHEYSARTANRPANPPANRELAKYSLELLPAVEYLESRNDNIPTTPSALIVKGLGGMFSKKKQQDNPPPPSSSSTGSSSAPNADNSQPTSATLMEMTTEVTSFSTSSLDTSVFGIPAGYTQIQTPPGQILGGRVGATQQN